MKSATERGQTGYNVGSRPLPSMSRISMPSARLLSRLVCLSIGVFLAAARLAVGAETAKTDSPKYEVRAERDLAYYTGPDADKVKHKLDLYLPQGKTDFPVVMFVHGGAWMFGDKDFFGVHEAIGRMFARHGIGAAVISYRLTPTVQHPE